MSPFIKGTDDVDMKMIQTRKSDSELLFADIGGVSRETPPAVSRETVV